MPKQNDIKVTRRKVSDYQLDPMNANLGTERGTQMLEYSVGQFGPARSGVVDKNGIMRAGNHTAEQLVAAGIEDVIEIETDGKAWVVVKRNDMDEQAGKSYAIADNRTGELIEFNPAILSQLLDEGIDLKPYWTDAELSAMLNSEENTTTDYPGDLTDQSAEWQNKWKVKENQLWKIGNHRLLCGDSSNADNVNRLLNGAKPVIMMTDPPYGVNYDPAWREEVLGSSGQTGKVSNDDKVSFTDHFKLVSDIPVIYLWHAALFADIIAQDMKSLGYELRSQIIWVKNSFAISQGHYHWQHKPCYYLVKKGSTANWTGARDQTTTWMVEVRGSVVHDKTNPDSFESGHGTQKPVELFTRAYRNHTKRGEAVYEPFAGSGSALVAAELLALHAYACELMPNYCASILERMNQMGIAPELIE